MKPLDLVKNNSSVLGLGLSVVLGVASLQLKKKHNDKIETEFRGELDDMWKHINSEKKKNSKRFKKLKEQIYLQKKQTIKIIDLI